MEKMAVSRTYAPLREGASILRQAVVGWEGDRESHFPPIAQSGQFALKNSAPSINTLRLLYVVLDLILCLISFCTS